MPKRLLKVSKKRTVNTYYEIWRASYWTFHKAEHEKEGSYFQIMASLIFTAFAFEAYLNHLGERLFSCWDDLERLSPRSKINVISEKLKIQNDDSKRPFQTIKDLFDFRNDVAHGKTVVLKNVEEIKIADANMDEHMNLPLEAEWDKYCSLDNAQRAREDVEEIIHVFHKAAGMSEESLFKSEPWSSEATLVAQHD